MDGGIRLTSRRSLPAEKFLGVNMEFFASTKNNDDKDSIRQHKIFCGSEEDTNGWLLYPDGAPRYRMIYVNGGKAASHARSMGPEAKERINEFVDNGGSYLGTCAGAYIASRGTLNRKTGDLMRSDIYWAVWPGVVSGTRLTKSFTGMDLGKKSPLLRYYDFGGDKFVDSVRHNGGCYAYTANGMEYPDGTECLARYRFNNTKRVQIDGEMAVWSRKANDKSGRVILCGSHPESVGRGERLEFMSAIVLYAMEGNPLPQPKGLLIDGEVREMNKRTEDKDPAYTRIGDRQYHHFELEVPRKCKRAVISLDGYDGSRNFSLSLCAKRGEMAFHENTLFKSVAVGCRKQLVLERPKSGKWYVSVFCETTVNEAVGRYGTYYYGRTEVLNGVPYKISVKYE